MSDELRAWLSRSCDPMRPNVDCYGCRLHTWSARKSHRNAGDDLVARVEHVPEERALDTTRVVRSEASAADPNYQDSVDLRVVVRVHLLLKGTPDLRADAICGHDRDRVSGNSWQPGIGAQFHGRSVSSRYDRSNSRGEVVLEQRRLPAGRSEAGRNQG